MFGCLISSICHTVVNWQSTSHQTSMQYFTNWKSRFFHLWWLSRHVQCAHQSMPKHKKEKIWFEDLQIQIIRKSILSKLSLSPCLHSGKLLRQLIDRKMEWAKLSDVKFKTRLTEDGRWLSAFLASSNKEVAKRSRTNNNPMSTRGRQQNVHLWPATK